MRAADGEHLVGAKLGHQPEGGGERSGDAARRGEGEEPAGGPPEPFERAGDETNGDRRNPAEDDAGRAEEGDRGYERIEAWAWVPAHDPLEHPPVDERDQEHEHGAGAEQADEQARRAASGRRSRRRASSPSTGPRARPRSARPRRRASCRSAARARGSTRSRARAATPPAMNTATAITSELRCSRFIGALVRLPTEDGVDAGALQLVDLHLRDVERGRRSRACPPAGRRAGRARAGAARPRRARRERPAPGRAARVPPRARPRPRRGRRARCRRRARTRQPGRTTRASAAESPDGEDRQRARGANRFEVAVGEQCLGAVGLGALRCLGPVDGDDQRDAVALGYGLAQTSRAGHAAQWYLSGLHWLPWHRAAAARREASSLRDCGKPPRA